MHHLGLIGLGTMGANLARNAARNGATVAVYNRTTERTDEFIKAHGKEGSFVSCHSLTDLITALPSPRAILLMVKAGDAVDAVIEELLPHLSKGDMLIDAGNSHYRDTERREKLLSEKGIRFIGMGVSGGEEGALNGPSMMPGGDPKAWKEVSPLLLKMAADDGVKGKCVAHIGPGGSGHFVKMVHNGIEYGIMQLIAETYDILRSVGKMTPEEFAELFADWNEGDDLRSFLIEITAKIFRKKDEKTKKPMIDVIADQAGQKGTGKWTTESAMTLGVAIPTITAAVDARILSGDQSMRSLAQAEFPEELMAVSIGAEDLQESCRAALELAIISCYVQGFELLRKASEEWSWNLNLSEIARIWRGGCIIRSELLAKFQSSLGKQNKKELIDRFRGTRQVSFRRVVAVAVAQGIPVPSLSASLSYYDALRRKRLPQHLIQAQRDFFGAHGFQRIGGGSEHVQWE